MFKLPSLLQPQLVDGTPPRTKGQLSSYSGFWTGTSSPSRALGRDGLASLVGTPGGVEAKDWEAQAKEITSDMITSEKYKSLALHAEVKLAEALERCERVSPASVSTSGNDKPNRLKTAVCCQLLGEFAELCGPFAGALRSLRDELLNSVYSGFYVSSRGTLVFYQLTWFAVCERLEKEKEVMAEERTKFQAALESQQDVLARIEDQLTAYQRAMSGAQAEAAGMRGQLDAMAVARDGALTEAKTGREELKRARKEWLKTKDEFDAERAAHAGLRAQHAATLLALSATVCEHEAAEEALAQELAAARAECAARVHPNALTGLRDELARERADGAALRIEHAVATRAQSTAMRKREAAEAALVAELEAVRAQCAARVPADTVAALRDELARAHEAGSRAAARAELLSALLLPDPLPQPLTLSVTTDQSAYFITEAEEDGGAGEVAAGDNADARAPLMLSAAGLGVGPAVPRALRWPTGDPVSMEAHDLAATRALVASVWTAKAAHEASGQPRMALASFVWLYFARLCPGAAAREHEDVARHAYSLYHACASHAPDSASVCLFSAVLTGCLAEGAEGDCRAMLSDTLAAFDALPRVSGATGGSADGQADQADQADQAPCVSGSDAAGVLGALFPRRSQLEARRLRDALTGQFGTGAVPLAALADALAAARDDGREPSAFAELLAAQHLEALEAFGDEVGQRVEAALAAEPETLGGEGREADAAARGKEHGAAASESGVDAVGGGASAQQGGPALLSPRSQAPQPQLLTVTLDAVASVLSAVLSPGDAKRCIEALSPAGLPPQAGGSGSGGASSASGAGARPPPARSVDASTLVRVLRASVLLRPAQSVDLAGARAWAQANAAGV
ncbi:hypothetical protein FOA52_006502 [Chlamydomonas sp. UWO 241]|nr:hypothetical protein FOA52_006502 [Chlamydomonas sp. UWO 241]